MICPCCEKEIKSARYDFLKYFICEKCYINLSDEDIKSTIEKNLNK